MPGDPFGDFYIHTCTVQQGASITAPNPRDPQGGSGGTVTGIDFDTPAANNEGVPLRLMQVNARQRAELEAQNTAGTVIPNWVAQMPWDPAPDTLRDLDAAPHPAITHRLVNVRQADGSIYHAGPFDILNIEDPGAEGEALVLLLRSER